VINFKLAFGAVAVIAAASAACEPYVWGKASGGTRTDPATASATTDSAAVSTAKAEDTVADAPATPADQATTPGPAIHIGAFTASMAKDKYKKVELRADGSIWADGKKIAMISGSDIKDASGGTLFTVLSDGRLKGDDLPSAKMRVESDGLVRGENKVTVADDGTIMLVKKSGVETIGKIDKGARDQRTAVLVLAAAAVAGKQQ